MRKAVDAIPQKICADDGGRLLAALRARTQSRHESLHAAFDFAAGRVDLQRYAAFLRATRDVLGALEWALARWFPMYAATPRTRHIPGDPRMRESILKLLGAHTVPDLRRVAAQAVRDHGLRPRDRVPLRPRLERTGRRRGAPRGSRAARPTDPTRVLRAGFGAHLGKPVDPGELVAVVASLAGRLG